MGVSREQILDAISAMSVMDVCALIKDMEDKFGVTAAAPVAVASAAAPAAAAAEEKTEFNVVLTGAGANKVGVIKVVRTVTTLGLKEAKDLVEGTPAVVKEGVTKEEAASLKKQLEEAGATVDIK